jgi:hypothetical protein
MQNSKRELNRRRVRRLTQWLAAAAVAATAVFAGAAARASGTAGDDSNATVSDSASLDWSSGSISPPTYAPTQSYDAPATVSGGS